MKLLALLFAIGFAAGSGPLSFRGGQEYVFKYDGRLLTGIPELSAQHFSGLGVKAKVHLQVTQEGQYKVSVTDVKFSKVNQRLQASNEVVNWRNIILPSFTEVPNLSAEQLQKPVTFRLSPEDGRFESMQVSGDEPQWSVNFKKALVVLFQTKTLSVSEGIENNMIGNGPNGDELKNFWSTREKSLDGFCDVTYQINELPQYIINQQPELLPQGKTCQQKYYEILRSRDLSSCDSRSVFSYYKPGHFRCSNAAECEGMWSKSSITRYIACGPRTDLQVLSIFNEGEMQRALNGPKTEKVLTGARQVLKLMETHQQLTHTIPEPTNPVTYESLQYEYESPEKKQQLSSGVQQIGKYQSIKKSLIESGVVSEQQLQQELKQQVKQVIKEIVEQDLERIEDLPKKQVTMKALQLASAFSMLTKQNIDEVYGQLKSQYSGNQEQQHSFKNIFFDTVIMGGSYDDVMFIKEKIEGGEVDRFQIASIFLILPSYVISPHTELLDALLQVIQSRPVQEEFLVFSQAVLGYSQLLHNVCLAPNRKTSYPTSVYNGQFCQPDSQVIVGKFLPFLQQQLNSAQSVEQRSVIIIALGTLAHRNAFPLLLPILEGLNPISGSGGQPITQQERLLALYSISRIGLISPPETAEPILFAILNNQAEHTEVRVAAFNSLLRLNPSTAYMHRVAALTWREKNVRVLEAINTALFSLAGASETEPLQTRYTSLPRKAWIIYPLIKKTGNRIPATATIVNNDYLETLGIGYQGVTSYYYGKAEGSYMPSNFYYQIVHLLNRYQYTPNELGMRFVNHENMVQQVVELLTPGSNHATKQEFARKVSENLSSEWKKVIEKLGIMSAEEQGEMNQVEASFFMKMFQAAPIFHSLKSQNSRELKEKLQRLVLKDRSLKDSICGEHKINLQKFINYMPSESSLPSELGLPIIVESHAPSVRSLKGSITVECNSNGQGILPSIKANLRKLMADQKIHYIGTVVPFSSEYVYTVLDEQSIVNVPAEYSVQFDSNQHQLKIKAKALQGLNRPVDIVHYSVRPYTVAQKITNLQPFSLNPSVKPIKSQSEAKEMKQSLGQDLLGLDMSVSVKTESRFTDYRAIIDKLRFYNYNPINLFRFPFATSAISEKKTPSLRMHQIKVTYDPTTSPTKEIDLSFKLGVATKVEGEPIKYLKISKVPESEMSSYFPEWKRVVPVKIEHKPIGESSEHQIRQQKIKSAFEKLSVESGTGSHLIFQATFLGGRPKTYTYDATYVFGSGSGSSTQLKNKWSLQLGGSQTNKKFCMNGEMELSNVPEFKVQELRSTSIGLRYSNVFGYGSDCSESQVKITGNSRVSDSQKEWSRKSPEGKRYEELLSRRVPMVELSEVAEIVRRQASTYDEVDVTVEYTNVHGYTVVAGEYTLNAIKALLWPYATQPSSTSGYSTGSISSSPVSGKQHITLRFIPETNSVNIKLTSQGGQQTKFGNVRLPRAISYFYPQNAISQASWHVANLHTKLTYPSCKIEGQWLSTFSNQTVPHHLDECFHLISADASFRKEYALLMRKTTGSQGEDAPKEMKVLLGKSVILLTPSGSHSRISSSIQVQVNGTGIQLAQGEVKAIKDNQGNQIAQVYMTRDKVIKLMMLYNPVFNGPSIVVMFDGHKAKVEVSGAYFKSLTGMCGDLVGPRASPSVGPDGCIYSSPKTVAASHRITCGQKQLTGEIQSKYEEEKSRCIKARSKPTKLSKSSGLMGGLSGSLGSSGSCTKHAHQIIERASDMCFSRKPVTNCGEGCRPTQSISKSVSFTCMPRGRTAERYAEKVRQGQILPELERLPESFALNFRLPKNCVQA